MIDRGRLAIRYDVLIEYDGTPIMDSRLAILLKLVKEKGSLLAASRALGIPYARAWEMVVRVERILGTQLIESHRGGRGGGGARITNDAEELLEIYWTAEARLRSDLRYSGRFMPATVGEPELIMACSHDPIIELVASKVQEGGYGVDVSCVGSGRALAALSLDEVDVACAHLFDPDTQTYNQAYLRKLWLADRVVNLSSYGRELVFGIRPGLRFLTLDEIIRKILDGQLRIVNRNRGSGTRVYLDYLLSKASPVKDWPSKVVGYNNEVFTHTEVAKQVASGKADVGLMLRHAAEMYGLESVHVTWERYECFALKERMMKPPVKEMARIMKSGWLKKIISKMPGYRI